MEKSALKLGVELNDKITKLNKEREKYFNVFEYISERLEECESINIDIARVKGSTVHFRNSFPTEELLKLYEYRIKQLDYQIEELEEKFKQL